MTEALLDEPQIIDLWDADERAAWLPPEKITPAEWATKHRFLPHNQSQRGGTYYKHEHAPYSKGLLNLAHTRGVVELNVMKASQIGISEGLIRNDIAYCADVEPDPMGLTLPDRNKGRKVVMNRLIPMFRECPKLTKLFTKKMADMQSEQLKLVNGFLLHLMWSGSASSMASDPMRRVWNDEVDKHVKWTGKDASPVANTKARIKSYEERRFQGNVSTPTDETGQINVLFGDSDVQLYFLVPCPHCGVFQRLTFGQLKWEHYKGKDGADLEPRKLASKLKHESDAVWYECAECKAKIYESQKAAMVRGGHWGPDDGTAENVELKTEWPRGTRIAVQISALYCLWVNWADIAAEFVVAKGDPQAMYDFRTQVLGEPFEAVVEKTPADVYSGKSERATLDEGICPEFTARLICTIDTQKDHFKFVVRAWGPELRSQRVLHGRAETFRDLDMLFTHQFPVEAGLPARKIDFAVIDTGGTRAEDEENSRTMEVYTWAHPRRALVRMIKGSSRPHGNNFVWLGTGILKSGLTGQERKVTELPLWHVATHHFQDLLAGLISQGLEDDDREEIWLLNKNNCPLYNKELSAMHKKQRPGIKFDQVWVPVGAGVKYDFRHCEAYQVAAAYMCYVHLLPTLEQFRQMRQRALESGAKPPAPTDTPESRRGGGGWEMSPY